MLYLIILCGLVAIVYGIWSTQAVLAADATYGQRLMARAFNLPVVWGTDGRFKGTSLSVAREAGVPAREIGTTGGSRLRMTVGGRPVIDAR